MKRHLFIVLVCLVLALLSPTDSTPWAPPPGSRGYGLTVFRGTRPTRFPITVLGVASRALAGQNMILVRLQNTSLNRRGTGIVAGMSGSPIYVGGRLIGALAYGWAYSQEPIGGVTPLPAMLGDLRAHRVRRAGLQPEAMLDPPLTIAGRHYTRLRLTRNASDTAGTLVMTPVSSMLTTSGLNPGAMDYLSRILRPLPLQAVAVPATAAPPGTAIPPLVPGSAVGIQLMEGDLEASVTGTLTWRHGDRMLAFGHSVAQLGSIGLPMTASYINAILPSYQRPFKLASQIGIVGRMTGDRLYAGSGIIHAPVSMVNVGMSLHQGRFHKTFHIKVAQDRRLTHRLVPTALVALLDSRLSRLSNHTAHMSLTIDLKGHNPIRLRAAAAGYALDSQLGTSLALDLATLMDNPFAPLKLAHVGARVDVQPGKQTARITRLSADRSVYLPGQRMRLSVRLQPYDKATPITRHLTLTIPPDTPAGTIKLSAAAADQLGEVAKSLGNKPPEPGRLGVLIDRLRHRQDATRLLVGVSLPLKEVQVEGQPLPFYPSFRRHLLRSTPGAAAASDRSFLPVTVPSHWVLQGKASLHVKLKAAPNPDVGRLFPTKSHKPAPTPSPQPAIFSLPGRTFRWDVRKLAQLRRGTFRGTGLDQAGNVLPAPAFTNLCTRPEAWPRTLAVAGDTVYAGWSDGTVTATGSHGNCRRLTRLEAPLILSMAAADHSLWIGTGPWGEVLELGVHGNREGRWNLPVDYVWALLDTPQGVLAACGAPARLYLIPRTGQPKLLWSAPATHITALARASDGHLLATTADPGALYRLDATGRDASLVRELSSPEPSAVASLGKVTAVCNGGTLSLYSPGARPQRFDSSDGPLTSLAVGKDGSLWAGAAEHGVLYHVIPRAHRSLRLPLARRGGVSALAIEDGRLLVCLSRGHLKARSQGSSPGSYDSPVFDATTRVDWGDLRWTSQPAAGAITMRTRSGPTSTPDGSWSHWSAPLATSNGSRIPSPADRYLQVRASLTAGSSLQAFDAAFTPPASAPSAHWLSPAGGERWHGTHQLEWQLDHGDAGQLDYRILLARHGTGWTQIKPRTPLEHLVTKVPMSSSGKPDGSYRVKLELYTAGSRSPALTLVSKSFILSNTPPSIAWKGHHQGVALGAGPVAVVDVSYRSQGKPWRHAIPGDGIFDSPREPFTIPLPSGTRVEIRVRDECGQTATLTRTLK